MGDYATMRFSVHEKIATVVMDRPPVNAMSIGFFRDLAEVFGEIDRRTDEIHVAILTGAGRCFCGGRDLIVAETEDAELRTACAKAAMGSIYHCKVPVIAAVNGPAMGGGFALAALCDIILASERAVFAMPEIDANANPSVAMLLRGMNQYQARAMAFTGERYSGEDMYRVGVVRAVTPHDELMNEAIKLAQVLAAKSPLALRAAKWSANEIELMFADFEQAYRAIESRVSIQLFASDDHREAAAAFAQKRAPVFTGR